MYDLCLKNGKIYLNGEFLDSNIYIKEGRIFDITLSEIPSKEIYDVSGKILLPGFIDPHVHFELNVGRYTSVDDFASGSLSAAYGGITTIIDFLDPIKTVSEFHEAFKRRLKLAKKSVIDYAFHTTIANPMDSPDKIINVSKSNGIQSIKLFTTYSDSNRRTYDGYIFDLLRLSKEKGVVVSSHSENDEIIKYLNNRKIKIADLSKSRPTIVEVSEILKLASMTEIADGQLYIVHVSSGETLEKISFAFKHILGRNLNLESCPHYFYFNENEFKKSTGYLYTLCPPFKEEKDRLKMFENFNLISTIGTDHCPFYREDKKKEFINEAPMGIGGVEFSFPLMYSLFGNEIIDKYTENVARIFGLYPQKGNLMPGADADIVVFDPNAKYKIGSHHSKCDYNVYEKFEVKGKIISTILHGNFIIKDLELNPKLNQGKYISRGDILWG